MIADEKWEVGTLSKDRCIVVRDGQEITHCLDRGTATAIAALPQLLRACREYIQLVDGNLSSGGMLTTEGEVYFNAIRAALNAAEPKPAMPQDEYDGTKCPACGGMADTVTVVRGVRSIQCCHCGVKRKDKTKIVGYEIIEGGE